MPTRDDGRGRFGGWIHDRTPIGAFQDAARGDWDRLRRLGLGTLGAVAGGVLGGPLGAQAGRQIGNGNVSRALGRLFSRGGGRMNREERALGVPLSPSPGMADDPEQLREALGLTDWMRDFPGFRGTSVGIGPPGGQTGVEYDPEYFENLVAGYLSADPSSGAAQGGSRSGGGRSSGGSVGSHGALADSVARGGSASIGAALASRIGSMRPTDTAANRRNKNSNRDKQDKV